MASNVGVNVHSPDSFPERKSGAYQRPPIRAFDPNRVNRLWKLVLALVGDLDDVEVANALNAVGVPVSRSRVAAWSRAEGSDKFSPMNVAELEAALDALVRAAREGRE